MRSMEAWPRWEAPLSTIQNTRLAEAYGSVVMTFSARSAKGAMPVVGRDRADHPGAVDVVRGEVGQGAAAVVPELDAPVRPGAGRGAGMDPVAGPGVGTSRRR